VGGGEEIVAEHVVLALPADEAARLLGKGAAQAGYVACLDVALSNLPSAANPVVFDFEQPRFMTVQSAVAQLAPDRGAVILPHMHATSALPRASQGGLGGRPSARSAEVDNLYFAGDWVGPRGFQLDASLSSAREAAGMILNARLERAA
jgi:predicted NAD/FAD-dependent oxidoreductase